MIPDYCPADNPGQCALDRGHDCALPAHHFGAHECFKGHKWVDEKEVVA